MLAFRYFGMYHNLKLPANFMLKLCKGDKKRGRTFVRPFDFIDNFGCGGWI